MVADDGWIYPSGNRLEDRTFRDDDDLVNPFVAINAAPLDDRVRLLLSFIKTFGLLGQTVLDGNSRRRPDGRLASADSVAWGLQHARNVDRIMQLYHSRYTVLDQVLAAVDARAVRVRGIGDETAKSIRYPFSLQVPIQSAPWQIGIRPTIFNGPTAQTFPAKVSRASDSHRSTDPLTVSRRILAELLNPNLVGVPREYDPMANRQAFRFRALIQLLYWRLADHLGHDQIRQCRCGTLFFALDERQMAHSRTCYRRFYMQDFREGRRRRQRPVRKGSLPHKKQRKS
jgi:hypothetical protein